MMAAEAGRHFLLRSRCRLQGLASRRAFFDGLPEFGKFVVAASASALDGRRCDGGTDRRCMDGFFSYPIDNGNKRRNALWIMSDVRAEAP